VKLRLLRSNVLIFSPLLPLELAVQRVRKNWYSSVRLCAINLLDGLALGIFCCNLKSNRFAGNIRKYLFVHEESLARILIKIETSLRKNLEEKKKYGPHSKL
jgi:hypothetical protein